MIVNLRGILSFLLHFPSSTNAHCGLFNLVTCFRQTQEPNISFSQLKLVLYL
jgi:hypothetical protein